MLDQLVEENSFLATYIPATEKAFVFRVKSRVNRGLERFHYGPLPLVAGLPLASYVGGVIPVPANGVLPMTAYTPLPGLSFPMSGAFDETDMWYIPKDYRERLFHVILNVTPRWLRCQVAIPKGVSQGRFQRDKVSTGVDKTFGFTRGGVETIHFPGIHYSYLFGNDTNLAVYTGVDFTYGEYVVEIPKDAELIYNVLVRRMPSKWVTIPINIYDATVKRAFAEVYGIEGFPLYPVNQREKAISEYTAILKDALI